MAVLVAAAVGLTVLTVMWYGFGWDSYRLGLLRPALKKGRALIRFPGRAGRRVEEDFRRSLCILKAFLESGASLEQAVRRLADEGPPAVREGYRMVLSERLLGSDWSKSLSNLEKVLGARATRPLKRALAVHVKLGGDLGGVLASLIVMMDETRRLRGKLESGIAEARTSAYITAFSPLALLLILAVIRADMLTPLIAHPVGRMASLYAAGSWLTGFWFTRRLLDSSFLSMLG